MNDERRLGLECLFDGEAASGERPVDLDPEDLAYLERLSRLRTLARAHDPAASLPSRSHPTGRWRSRSAPFAGAAIAAGILALLLLTRSGPLADNRPVLSPTPRPAPPREVKATNRVAHRPARTTSEANLYRWANDAPESPERAARAFLEASATRRGRSARREILALELANATPDAAGRIARSRTFHTGTSHTTIRRHSASSRPRPESPPKA